MGTKALAVLISGSGSNFKAIHKACEEGRLNCRIKLVISDRKGAAGLAYAKAKDLPTKVLAPQDFLTYEAWDSALKEALLEAQVDLLILAGFLRKIGSEVLAAYPERILNIHPALLPKYGGAGCYGLRPHEMALANGDEEAGATVHFVNEVYDAGQIILQRSIPIRAGESAESLQKRVLSEVEWKLYTEAIAKVINDLEGKK
ncbi:MAG: phosphoribosylglycinamide formyltransferase [Eubacteriales bacterium]|nr:phosphoribosylglycinamide formyltransferase [Eubacteriales bacterium]